MKRILFFLLVISGAAMGQGSTIDGKKVVIKAGGGATLDSTRIKKLISDSLNNASTVFSPSYFAGLGTSGSPLTVIGGTGTSGALTYDTTQSFYYDTTNGRIVVKQGIYKRRFKPIDSLATVFTISTPASFTATPTSSSQINLTWSDVSNETNYVLERSPNGSTSWTTVNSPAANATSYNNTGLTPSTPYYYRLSAVGNGTTYLTSAYATANATTAGATSNLLAYSEDLTNAVWTKNNTTVDANATVAPDGTTTADRLKDLAESGVSGHGMYQTFSNTGTKTYVFSVYVKSDALTRFAMVAGYDASNIGTGVYSVWDGTTSIIGGGDPGAYTFISDGMVAAANGFNRYYMIFSVNTTTAATITFNLNNPGNNYQGTVQGMYAWGFDLKEGSSLTTYVKTP